MTNLLLHGYYYYRYREKRKQIKTLVDSASYVEAQTQLNAAITEHQTKYGNIPETKLDFNYGERLAMNHAALHLNRVILDNDPSFVIDLSDGITPITVGHQSDIVKEALLHIPKSDYSEISE